MAEDIKVLKDKLESLVTALSSLEEVENNYKEANEKNKQIKSEISELIETVSKSVKLEGELANGTKDAIKKIEYFTNSTELIIKDYQKEIEESINEKLNSKEAKIESRINELSNSISKIKKLFLGICGTTLITSIVSIIILLVK